MDGSFKICMKNFFVTFVKNCSAFVAITILDFIMDLKYQEVKPIEKLGSEKDFSKKSYGVAVCLSGIFGVLGIQHFYLERWALGFFDLGLSIAGFVYLFLYGNLTGLTLLGIDLVHTVYVTYKLLVGEYKDGYGKIVAYPGQK